MGLRGAMSHLRKRLGTGQQRPRIVTEPHVGYRLGRPRLIGLGLHAVHTFSTTEKHLLPTVSAMPDDANAELRPPAH